MRLEEYWGVGPKTAARLEDELGYPSAVEAIESADSRALAAAGLSRGRATQILRRANGGQAMDMLAAGDTRAVYKELLALAQRYAVTRHAADRIRVLTPLGSREAMVERLDAVLSAVQAWRALDDATRASVLDAFESYDSVDGGELAAVEVALALAETGAAEGPFAPLAALDADALSDAAEALAALDDGSVEPDVDAELDRLRDARAAVEDMEGTVADVLETIRSEGVRGTEEFREAFVQYLTTETGLSTDRVREAMARDAIDASDFVTTTLRNLAVDLRTQVVDRESTVAADLQTDVEAAREEVDAAVDAVSDVSFYVSLARFAVDFELARPEFVEGRDALAVVNARNLSLVASADAVQPVTYAVGEHSLPDVPAGDRVTVLTGANSGGKTTLLETLCQVALLAQMGLPVPADRAEVSVVDTVVFHRRHASFNAGVLESTLRSIVPPLTDEGRTLMLVDEFEAITEPGSAADLLHGLVTLTVEREALGVFVTHLAEDLEPLPETARTDGIFAEGLSADLELRVDYQPRFDTVGRSTPEFIVSRLVADAADARERSGFETLAEAVGLETVQRTLADARWTE